LVCIDATKKASYFALVNILNKKYSNCSTVD
jgi:hypothetical protein